MASNNRIRRKGKNPNNEESELFKSLTRLFSGPITTRRTQTGRQLRRRHLDMYAKKFRSASGKQFKKVESYAPMSKLNSAMFANRNRAERYVDFDEMEYTPEIASSLDIYADEMTTHSALQPMLNIKCSNEEISYLLQNLYHKVLNIDYNLFGWCRTMCKYGDLFLYLDIDDSAGIQNCIGLPPQEIERLEGEDPMNPNYVQFQWNSGGMTFENWQVAHFRILGNDKFAPYGTSVLEPARRIWRQLTMLEDAMMAYRIVRAPERRLFKIDVGNIAPEDVEQYMQKVMTQMKRHQVVDPTTGRVDLRYNPLSIEEDYFIPVRGGSASDISNLPGSSYNGGIDDVKYLRDKLFSALKIPQSYLSMGEGATEDKTTLAQKDIRFARTIQRLQRVVISELEKIGIIHLFTLGFRGDDLLSFKLALNNPSKIAELQELEHWDKKFSVAGNATEGYFSKRWVAEHMFGMSADEFIRCQREMFHDKKFAAALEAAAQPDEAAGGDAGGGLGDLGGDLGGDDLGGDLGGGDDLGDLGGGGDTPEPAAEPAGDEGETTLLAEPPAKRDDDARPRGRYEMKKKPRKARRGQQMSNIATGGEIRGSTARTTFPGKSGYGGLDSLAKGMFQENQEKENLEEEKLFTLSNDVKQLLESLVKKDDKYEAQ
jgi:hypothetical protein